MSKQDVEGMRVLLLIGAYSPTIASSAYLLAEYIKGTLGTDLLRKLLLSGVLQSNGDPTVHRSSYSDDTTLLVLLPFGACRSSQRKVNARVAPPCGPYQTQGIPPNNLTPM
jgi:hypothetical protein